MYQKRFCVFVLGLALVLATGASAQLGQGKVLFEYWMNLGGTAVSDLTGYANYPNNPDSSEWRDGFKSKVDWADNYGERARAYVTPPQTGDYTFWVSGDDFIDLLLSTDDTAANAVVIAQVPGWTGAEEWGKYPEQKSAPITLQAGQKYYIEGLHKEGGGGDSMTAAWAGPGIGDAATVISGAYVSAFIRDPEPLYSAQNPDPANGAVDIVAPLFGWTAGINAKTDSIYFGTSADLGAADFQVKQASKNPVFFYPMDLTPGVTYYWRVDTTDTAGVLHTGKVWSFTVMPVKATEPVPADGATDLVPTETLSWKAGQNLPTHDLYFGTDKDAVAAADTTSELYKGNLADATFDVSGLARATTYYWRVDEIDISGTLFPGDVWSFTVTELLVIDLGEKTLSYDNTVSPFFSELAYDVPADWTPQGEVALALRFQGVAGSKNSTSVDAGVYTITGSGTDIWNNSDQFRFGYMTLTGDGEIQAKVESIPNTSGSGGWSKAGVMIRESVAGDSAFVLEAVTGGGAGNGGGTNMQWRDSTAAGAGNGADGPGVSAPYWVKLTRVGDVFTAFYSADGVTWTQQTADPHTVVMASQVLIGLAVTSHVNSATTCTGVFSNVSVAGGVDQASATSQDIGMTFQSAEPIFAGIEDAAGRFAVVSFSDPAATQYTSEWTWKIPLSSFDGVDVKNVAKLFIGVGNCLNPTAGGKGTIKIDNVRVVKASSIAPGTDVTGAGDNVIGLPNNGNWPGAEVPPNAIDDKVSTKFLHFNGATEATGFEVQVFAGPSIVTGMTFTSANDSANRDPVKFELYGSKDSINGPWTLIASGDIVDFAGATEWPRLTKTTTPITFNNEADEAEDAFAFYKVMFPACRGPNQNSMQIAEVELLGTLVQ